MAAGQCPAPANCRHQVKWSKAASACCRVSGWSWTLIEPGNDLRVRGMLFDCVCQPGSLCPVISSDSKCQYSLVPYSFFLLYMLSRCWLSSFINLIWPHEWPHQFDWIIKYLSVTVVKWLQKNAPFKSIHKTRQKKRRRNNTWNAVE